MKENLSKINGKVIWTSDLAEALADDYLTDPETNDLILVDIWDSDRVIRLFSGRPFEVAEEQAVQILRAASDAISKNPTSGLHPRLVMDVAYDVLFAQSEWNKERISTCIREYIVETGITPSEEYLSAIISAAYTTVKIMAVSGVEINARVIDNILEEICEGILRKSL